MARKRDRIFALTVAIFFFITAFGLSFLVIYQAVTANHNSNTATSPPQAQTTLTGTNLANFTPVKTVTSLQKIDLKKGTGKAATASDTITVQYTGAVAATGIIFQSSKDSGKPVSLSLSQVIKGWQMGIPGMKVGGTRRLIIPASEAYGATPPQGSGIPANAPLVFDIQLVKVGS